VLQAQRVCHDTLLAVTVSVSGAFAKRIHFLCKSVQYSWRRLWRVPQQDVRVCDLPDPVRFVRQSLSGAPCKI